MAEHGAGHKETMQDKLARLAEQGREKSRSTSVTASPTNTPPRSKRTAHQARFSIEKFQLDLFAKEMDGRFSAYPLRPGSEFPTFLTRIPIFLPIKRGRKNPPLDQDNAMPFVTSWGRGRKHGPPLTVYDEDTLMAIARLRKNRLQGRPHHMPIPLSAIQPRGQQHKDDEIAVHVLACTMSDIQAECEDSDGGTNMQHRLASIKRLGATVMELSGKPRTSSVTAAPRSNSSMWPGMSMTLMRSCSSGLAVDGRLAGERIHLYQLGVRKQLSDTGKALIDSSAPNRNTTPSRPRS